MNKTLHLYWGRNTPLTYLRSLTVRSFRMLNPDWRIKIWVPETPSLHKPWDTGEQASVYNGYDYLPELLCTHVFNFTKVGIPNDTPEVHKSDLLRWYLLGTEGGIWSDFDILYKRPMIEFDDGPWYCRYRARAESHELFTAIGFLVSVGADGLSFYKDLFDFGISRIPQTAYQAFGALLLDEFIETTQRNPQLISPQLVYPYYTCHDTPKYFRPGELPQEMMLGYHWYAGNPANAKAEASITPENVRMKDYAICREVLKWME